jgi:hypothetical protein
MLVCRRCGKFSYDDVFTLGFEHIKPSIQACGDIFASDEGFLCISSRFKDLVQASVGRGLALKPAGASGWFVVNITLRFGVRSDVFRVVRGPCPECGRNRETLGAVRHLGQLISKPDCETFFSTSQDREGSSYSDRDLLLTEGIVKIMRQGGIKGAALHELLEEHLDSKLAEEWQRDGKVKFPKGSRIIL